MLHHRLSYPQCVSVEPFSSLLALDTSLYCVNITQNACLNIRCVYGVTYISSVQTWAQLGSTVADEIFDMCRINETKADSRRIRHNLECYSQREFYVSCLPRPRGCIPP